MTTNYDTDAVFTTGIVEISDTITPSPSTNKLYATGGNVYWGGEAITLANSSSNTSIPTPLYTWWDFGDGNNLARDTSTNSFDGTIVGSPRFLHEYQGRFNVLDLSSNPTTGGAPTHYLDFDSHISSFSLRNVTISLWFNLTANPTTSSIISFSDTTKSSEEYTIFYDVGTIKLFSRIAGVHQLSAVSSSGLNDGQWHHILATSGDDSVAFFIDGVEITNYTDGTSSTSTHSLDSITINNIMIGGNQDSGGLQWAFPGYVADVMIFDRQLSSEERTALFNDGRIAIDSTNNQTNLDTENNYLRNLTIDKTLESRKSNFVDSGIKLNFMNNSSEPTENIGTIVPNFSGSNPTPYEYKIDSNGFRKTNVVYFDGGDHYEMTSITSSGFGKYVYDMFNGATLSFSGWIYLEDGATNQYIWEAFEDVNNRMLLMYDGTTDQFCFFQSESGIFTHLCYTFASLNEWVHIAFTVDGSGTTFYVNGESVTVTTVVSGAVSDAKDLIQINSMYIGRRSTGVNYFTGYLSDFIFSTSVWSASQVKVLYTLGSSIFSTVTSGDMLVKGTSYLNKTYIEDDIYVRLNNAINWARNSDNSFANTMYMDTSASNRFRMDNRGGDGSIDFRIGSGSSQLGFLHNGSSNTEAFLFASEDYATKYLSINASTAGVKVHQPFTVDDGNKTFEVDLTNDRIEVNPDFNGTYTYTPDGRSAAIFKSNTTNGTIIDIVSPNTTGSHQSEIWFSDNDSQALARLRYEHDTSDFILTGSGGNKIKMGASLITNYENTEIGVAEDFTNTKLSVISENDAYLVLESDLGNDNETHHPTIWLKQDGGLIVGRVGLGRIGLGDNADNEMYIDTYQSGGAHQSINFRTSGNISATGGYGGVPTIVEPTTRLTIGQSECTFTNNILIDGTIETVVDPSITLKSSGTADANAGNIQFLESNGTAGWKIQHNASSGTVQDPLEINRIASGENPAVVINGTLANSPGVRVYHTASAAVGGSGALKVDGGVHTASLVVEDGEAVLHHDGNALVVEDTAGNNVFTVNTSIGELSMSDVFLMTDTAITFYPDTTFTNNIILSNATPDITAGDDSILFNQGVQGGMILRSGQDIDVDINYDDVGTDVFRINFSSSRTAKYTFGDTLFTSVEPISVTDSTASTTPTTGSILSSGGMGVSGNVIASGIGHFSDVNVGFGTKYTTQVSKGEQWLSIKHTTFDSNIGSHHPDPQSGILFVNQASGGDLPWGFYNGVVKDVASFSETSLRFDIGAINGLHTNFNAAGANTFTPHMTIRQDGDIGFGTTSPTSYFEVTGITTISDATESTVTTDGALVVTGGVGIGKSFRAGNDSSIVKTSGNCVFTLTSDYSGTKREGQIAIKSSTAGDKALEFYNNSDDSFLTTDAIFTFLNTATTEVFHITHGGDLNVTGNIEMPTAKHIQWNDPNWEIGRNIASLSTEQLTSNTIQIQVPSNTAEGFQVVNIASTALFEVSGSTAGQTTFRNQTVLLDEASLYLDSSSTSTQGIRFQEASTTVGYIDYNNQLDKLLVNVEQETMIEAQGVTNSGTSPTATVIIDMFRVDNEGVRADDTGNSTFTNFNTVSKKLLSQDSSGVVKRNASVYNGTNTYLMYEFSTGTIHDAIVGTTTNQNSFGMFVKFNSIGGRQIFFSYNDSDITGGERLSFGHDGSNIFVESIGNSTTRFTATYAYTTTNEWVHVGFRWRDSDNQRTLYINGNPEDFAAGGNNGKDPAFSGTITMYFGRENSGNYFDGEIADFFMTDSLIPNATWPGISTNYEISYIQHNNGNIFDDYVSLNQSVEINATDASTSPYSGALVVGGGVGVAENLHLAGDIFLLNTKYIQFNDGNWQIGRNLVGASGEDLTINTFQVKVFDGAGQGFQVINSSSVAAFEVSGRLTDDPGVSVHHTADSTSATTGALVVSGGIGVSGTSYMGDVLSAYGGLHVASRSVSTAGATTTLNTTDYIVEIDFSAQNGSVTLPTIDSTTAGKKLLIVNTSTTYTLTVNRGSTDTIGDGSTTSIVLSNQYDRVHLIAGTSTNGIWWIV